ncbi:hypothetical protein BRD17_01820 [Halobacteriales archaeon SW_7_68_16]|nr:MAG: hypothetical protein BRD17_01820 [Halobacteriales archaeon SW_7_68_16]
MTEISDSLRLLFETSLEKEGDRYVVSIPRELVESDGLSTDDRYRIALLSGAESGDTAATDTSESTASRSATRRPERSRGRSPRQQEPPVEVGDVRTVEIDTLGDQGDGIAKVERGFIVIVPGTSPGDEVEVEITEVKDTVAFAQPADGHPV